jgi:hypothetical protein
MSANPQTTATPAPKPTIEFMIVCLPDGETPETLTTAYPNPLGTTAAPTSRLWARPVRFRQRRALFGIRQGKKGTPTVCAGGPVRLLDLHALQTAAGFHAGLRWQAWQQAVKGSREARPWHEFEDQHLAHPDKVPLATVKRHFLGQARINAMRIFNAANPTAIPLDPYEVEMFQAGQQAYQHYHAMRAVCGDAMLTDSGQRLQPDSGTLADRITYFGGAWNLLRTLDGRQRILAVTV